MTAPGAVLGRLAVAAALAASAGGAVADAQGAAPADSADAGVRLVRGGEVLVPRPDGGYDRTVFRTLPDTTVRIVAGGDSVRLPADVLLDVARAYDGAVPLSPPVTRAGYDVEDGQISLYFSRRVPVVVVLGALALLAALALAFAVWAVVRIRRDARRKAELRAFRETLAAGREAERLRLARELHDGPLQEFHAVRLAVASGGGGPGLEADLLGAIRDVRRVVEDLRPPALDAYGLRAGLAGLATRFGRRYPDVAVAADVGEGPVGLDPDDQVAVYRVCQEALANVGRHAGASSVRVRYGEGGGRFTLEVADDGAGFDPSLPAPDGHFGLAGARERAEAIGAVLAVESAPGRGTRVALSGRVPAAPEPRGVRAR